MSTVDREQLAAVMSAMRLPYRRSQVLRVIVRHCRRYGTAPPLREVAAAVGLRQPSTVEFHLKALETAGFVRRDPHGWVLAPAGQALSAAGWAVPR